MASASVDPLAAPLAGRADLVERTQPIKHTVEVLMRSLLRRATSRPSATSCLVQRVVAASLLATTAIVVACSGDSSTSTGPSPSKPPSSATYAMATVRGMTVPHTFTDAKGSKLTIQGGGLTMTADGKFTLN